MIWQTNFLFYIVSLNWWAAFGKLSCNLTWIYRSSHPEVFQRRGLLKICSKYNGEHPCRSVILIKMQSNFIEITLRHECSPINLLHIFRGPSLKNTSGWLLFNIQSRIQNSVENRECFGKKFKDLYPLQVSENF